jgi:putative transposase
MEKASRFTEEQIIGILGEHEAGAKTADVCRKHGISSATFYKWKAKYGGLNVSVAKRLKSLERQAEEASRRGDARQCDAQGYCFKKMVTPAARRDAVAHLRVAFKVSERRGCSTLGADRTSIRYRSNRPDDASVRARLRDRASIRRRFGYRRLQVLLRREGIIMNHKKLRRIYREERLQVWRRGGRKRALGMQVGRKTKRRSTSAAVSQSGHFMTCGGRLQRGWPSLACCRTSWKSSSIIAWARSKQIACQSASKFDPRSASNFILQAE